MNDPNARTPTPPDIPRKAPDEPPGFFDKASNIQWIKRIAWAAVIAFFIADFFVHYHAEIGLENIPGFYTIFGFVASVLLIAIAKIGGKPLKRNPDYYDE